MSDMSEWAKREVELACKREAPELNDGEWDYGCECYKSALKAYLCLLNDDHSGMSFAITKDILIRLMNRQPLTPIEEDPGIWNDVTISGEGIEEYQCIRYPSLFKNVYPDGHVEYSDIDRYFCMDEGTTVPYHGGGSGRIMNDLFPITMPYCPDTKKYKLVTQTILRDPKNGDFDAKAYLYCETPDGQKIVINRYFGETENGWEEVDAETWKHWYAESEVIASRIKNTVCNEREMEGSPRE